MSIVAGVPVFAIPPKLRADFCLQARIHAVAEILELRHKQSGITTDFLRSYHGL